MLKNFYEKITGLHSTYTQLENKDAGDHEAIKVLGMVIEYVEEELSDPAAAAAHHTRDEVCGDD